MSLLFNDEEIEANMLRRIAAVDTTALAELKAQIRREARKRCLDEIEALAKGESIESGIGADVERVYYLALCSQKAKKER